jgi:hypothetical protein
MTDKYNDDQGTRIAREPTGAGAEATEGMDGKPESSSHTHRSAYGGDGGEPKEPNDENDQNDVPTSRR